jgi:drug/metabolite transporter (DMT)-like permease
MTLSAVDIVIALSATVAWSLALVINKSLATAVGSLHMNIVRLWSGFTLLAAFVWALGRYDSTAAYSNFNLALLVSSGIVALAIGDTVFIRSLYFIYVSQAFPVGQCAFLVMTVVASILFLSETFTPLNLVGGGLILTGLYLISAYGYQSSIPNFRSASRKGLLLAFAAALAWTLGAVILKISVTELNPVFASGIRTFSAALALTLFQCVHQVPKPVSRLKRPAPRKLSWIALSGMLGYGVGGVAYVSAMQRVGAGRTVLITSLTPVLVLILSVLFLKERPTRRSVIGTVICVVGVMCLSV